MKVTILGCGTSTGVPRIGNDWGSCDPANPKNRRSRSSVHLSADNFGLLIDTSPDMRGQLLDTGIVGIDAVIWTHEHADHCHGIDDLRQILHIRREPVDGYGSASTMAALARRFDYIFTGNRGYPAVCQTHRLEDGIRIGPFSVRSVEQPHGPVTSTGLRIESTGGTLGYAIDFSEITDEMVRLYQDVDLLIVDALRHEPHPTHAHLDISMELVRRTSPKRVLLTHMDFTMDYDRLMGELEPHVRPAYDGQTMTLGVDR